MFTGIIEELGEVKQIKLGREPEIYIKATEVLGDLKTGDSVAVNGVCLTAKRITKDGFEADMMPETIKKTGLKELRRGSKVNLERAIKAGDRFGGHMVSGHVDDIGRIKRVTPESNARILLIEAPKDVMEFIVPKGSVAIDGISLTVVDVTRTGFSVSLIPHTMNMTGLGVKKTGSTVNIEVDMIARYVSSKRQEARSKRE